MDQNIERYEELHEEYKKLMDEYDELKTNNAEKTKIDQILEQLKSKQEEITEKFSEINPKQ
ncbi:MAG: hypothetical protein R3327_05275 [Nitrosopumilaceae archaeon]|nr:hypothetical protein [Nitrosopumilaceae archaeon]